jgi:hypothetical protein
MTQATTGQATLRAALTAALAAGMALGGLAGIGCYEKGDRESARPITADANPPMPAAEAPAPEGSTPPLARSHGPIISLPTSAGAGGGDAAGAPRWVVPKGWQETPPSSPMRRAQYLLPRASGDADDGECVVFYFGPGQGGDASSNIARWASMVTDPDGSPAPAITSVMQAGDRKIARVKTTGTYQAAAMGFGGAPPPPKQNWMMLGAVVPGSDANWFFRCTGPRRTITAQEPAFDDLLKSIH